MQSNQSSSSSSKERFLSGSLDFNYKMLVSACKFTTLYLLQKYNERQYLFQDPLERKYRVKIDKTISCSCHQGNLGHCIHSLFVLVKICKFPEDHSFLYQNSYTEQQLKTIDQFGVKSCCSIKKKRTGHEMIKVQQLQKLKQQMSSMILQQEKRSQQNIKQEKIGSKGGGVKQWPAFEPDTVCSICYDQIQNQSPIIDCLNCKNYFHTKCLKVWVSQQQKDNPIASCPMCRAALEQNIQGRITKMNEYYVNYHQSHGINCSSCKKDILIKLYKCLLCEQLYLCTQCYTKWQHKNHDRFIAKQHKRAQWSVCSRSQYNINKLNANLQYMRKCGQISSKNSDKNAEFKELMGEKYDEFMNSYIKKTTMLQHIMGSLLDVEKQIHKTYKKLDFVEQDIVCCVCRKKKIVGMRRMSCKHFIDEKCLKSLLRSQVRQCLVDKKYILPGLSGVQVIIQ